MNQDGIELEREDRDIHRWRETERRTALSTRIFDVTERQCREDVTDKRGTFVRIDSPDWVNVVALTPERSLVLIEQFRHGVDELTLEVPGGMVDPGESAEAAARRELEEETGFVSASWTQIGFVHPNPAIQSNGTTTFLALDARRAAAPRFDGTERCRLVLADWQDALELVERGLITHALVVNALFFADRALRAG